MTLAGAAAKETIYTHDPKKLLIRKVNHLDKPLSLTFVVPELDIATFRSSFA